VKEGKRWGDSSLEGADDKTSRWESSWCHQKMLAI